MSNASGNAGADPEAEADAGFLGVVRRYWYVLLPLAAVALISIVGGIWLLVMNRRAAQACTAPAAQAGRPAMPVTASVPAMVTPAGQPAPVTAAPGVGTPMGVPGSLQVQQTVPLAAYGQNFSTTQGTPITPPPLAGVAVPPALQTCTTQCLDSFGAAAGVVPQMPM